MSSRYPIVWMARPGRTKPVRGRGERERQRHEAGDGLWPSAQTAVEGKEPEDREDGDRAVEGDEQRPLARLEVVQRDRVENGGARDHDEPGAAGTDGPSTLDGTEAGARPDGHVLALADSRQP